MSDPVIAPARRGDAKQLAALSRRLIEHGLVPVWTEERLERIREQSDHLLLTARVGRALAGFGALEYRDAGAHLNLLAVEPSHQRRGIGRMLLGALEHSASAHGAARIRLEVRAGNLGAQAFYRAQGYERGGWLNNYYRDGEDALWLVHTLKPAG